MRGVQHVLIAAALTAGMALAGGAAQAAKFKVLHAFCKLKAPERTAILEWSSQGIAHQELRKQ